MNIDKYEIIFVNDFATPLLSAAYDAVSAFENLTTKRLDGLEVMNRFSTKPHKRTSFVFCRFEGECFEHLRSLGAAIYGPQIILHYVRENRALPKVSYPLFSTALMGAIATVTSVTGSEREYILKSVEMLHGHASRDLFDGVNVVITPKVGSKKYLVGASRGLHILLPSWINEAWRLSAIQDPIDMMLPVYTEKFRVPIFSQLVICVSGLSAEERKEVSDLVLKHGGRYSGMMKIGETTHLIVKQAVGLKYSHAKKWKIQIVSVRWLVDSVSKGFAVNEEEYRVSESMENCSTPTHKVNGCSLSFDNISVISHANSTTARVDETGIQYLHAESFLRPKPTSSLSVLSDCIVAFMDCSVDEVKMYSELVSELGGRLCTKLHDQVSEPLTHVVVGSLHTSTLVNMEKGIYYVRGSWLISCKQERSHVDEAAHLLVYPECSDTKAVSVHSEELTKRTLDTEDLGLINQYFGSGGLADLDDFTSGAGDTTATPTLSHAPKNNPSFSSFVNNTFPSCSNGIFSGLSFFLLEDLAIGVRKDLRKSICSSGGRVACSSPDADYVVAPFFVRSLPNVSSDCKFVTQYWIDHCIALSSIRSGDLNTERAFVPCIRSGPPPLVGCVITLSGFIGRDRSLLTAYSQALGAVTQECFLRKAVPSRDLAASTHLIAAKPDGRKWPAALQWGIPAVSRYWLYACAESWSRQDESQFPVRSVPEDDSSLSLNKADSLSGLNVTPVAKLPPTILPVPSNSDQQKCVTETLDLLHTPDWVCTKKYESLGDTGCDSVTRILEPSPPLSEQVARCLKKAVHKTAALPKRKLDLSDDEHETQPLRGVTICVSKHLSSRQVELNGIAKKLGGDFKWIYDKQVCTHLIAEYRPEMKVDESWPAIFPSNSAAQHTAYQDVALAERDEKHIVHPNWLSACLKSSRRLPENDFPAFEAFPPKELETSSETDQPAPKIPRTESSDLLGGVSRRLELMLDCSERSASGDYHRPPVPGINSTGSLNLTTDKPTSSDAVRPAECEESASFMRTAANSGPRRLRRNPRYVVPGPAGSALFAVPGGRAVAACESTVPCFVSESMPDRAHPVQSLMVRWQYEDAPPLSPTDTGDSSVATQQSDPPHSTACDPIPVTVGTSNCDPAKHSDIPPVNVLNTKSPDALPVKLDDIEKPKEPEPTRRYVISFSGLAPDTRDHYANVVNQLGGEVDNHLTISDDTTHLIVHTPTRSEKYLICLATGKWILHKSYLDACLRESRWVDESNFEWGGPGTEPLLMQLSPSALLCEPSDNRPQQSAQIRDLARAARHWRLAGGNAFQNWKVIFGPGCDKEMSFRRVIEAGGGRVLASAPPYPPASMVTHSFYKRRPNAAITPGQFPLEYQWLRIDYLSAYLTTGLDVPRQEFALETI